MRIVPFPGHGEAGPDAAWQAELEAALNGEGEDVMADSWRELRADVRALAPAMTPEFESRLRERLAEQGARLLREVSPVEPPRAPEKGRLGRLGGLGRLRPAGRGRPAGRWHPAGHLGVAAGLVGSVAIAAVLVVVVVGSGGPGPGESGTGPVASSPAERAAPSSVGAGARAGANHAANGTAGASVAGASGGAAASALAAGAEAGAPGRVQQRGATLSLTASASEVQVVADRVARLATSLGGFVQSSQVQLLAPREGTSHAELDLRLPSAKLTAALAALGQLAPVRSESQSLQDITNTYDAARQRLGDARAERQALLRALADASTEGQIDSLRERLAEARHAIAEAQSAFHAVSQRASTSEVEVTVLGDAHAASEGLTLHRGLHDAGKVLVVTLAGLLIALAVLAPLALLVLALASARRVWRRYQRERVLDGR
jgi:hypothetical protein